MGRESGRFFYLHCSTPGRTAGPPERQLYKSMQTLYTTSEGPRFQCCKSEPQISAINRCLDALAHTGNQEKTPKPRQVGQGRYMCGCFPPSKAGDSHGLSLSPSFWRGAFLPWSLRTDPSFYSRSRCITEVLGREEGEKPANPKPNGPLQAAGQ